MATTTPELDGVLTDLHKARALSKRDVEMISRAAVKEPHAGLGAVEGAIRFVLAVAPELGGCDDPICSARGVSCFQRCRTCDRARTKTDLIATLELLLLAESVRADKVRRLDIAVVLSRQTSAYVRVVGPLLVHQGVAAGLHKKNMLPLSKACWSGASEIEVLSVLAWVKQFFEGDGPGAKECFNAMCNAWQQVVSGNCGLRLESLMSGPGYPAVEADAACGQEWCTVGLEGPWCLSCHHV